jgi:hypothetical protein
MDFGTLKNTFTQTYIASHISGDDKEKELYKTFLGILKESETLKSHFIVYKNLEGKTLGSEFEANEYLKENLAILDKFRGDKSIVTESKKLVNLLDNNDIDYKQLPYLGSVSERQFNESLHTLTTTKKDISNLDDIHEAKITIIKWLMEDKTPLVEDRTNVRENLDVKRFLDIATEKYNEKYSELSEEEKNIIKVLGDGNDETKSTLLNTMIKETVSLVNNRLESIGDNLDLKTKLLETKGVVYDMGEYNVDTFGENIKKLYDIKSVFTS